MDFSFSPDQQLLKNSARAFLDEHCKPELVRALFSDPRGESEALWKEIAQLGWLGLALPEEVGGSGLAWWRQRFSWKRWDAWLFRGRIWFRIWPVKPCCAKG